MTAISAESDAERFARQTAPLCEALRRRARRLTVNPADADDLVQDTLLHAYRGFGSFEDGTNLKAWLFRILHNRWVSAYRQAQSRPTLVALEAAGDVADDRSAEAEVLADMPDGDVGAALGSLPDGVRSVVFYTAVEGYTYAETAALLDIPIGTVMSRVSRGKQRLRVALAHRDHGCPTEALTA